MNVGFILSENKLKRLNRRHFGIFQHNNSYLWTSINNLTLYHILRA